MLIRKISKKDNNSLSLVLREVLVEMNIPRVGSAYEDTELDNMFEAYQSNRSIYYVIEENKKILGGAGINPLQGGNKNICELQKMYFHNSMRGKGYGSTMIDMCLDFARKVKFEKCYIETMPNMIDAQKLYLKKGFSYIDKPLGNTGHSACPVWMIKKL